MEMLTTVGFAIAGFIVVLLMIFWIGLKTKIPEKEAIFKGGPVEYVPWKKEIPDLVRQHYESIYETSGMPVINTAIIQGKAKYKISNLWMPVWYHTWIENKTGFLRELDFFWYGKTIIKGVDFWINGVGALQANGVIRMNETGKNVTESQYISGLSESLITGTYDFSQEQAQWKIASEHEVLLLIQSQDGRPSDIKPIKVHFEGTTGRIKGITAERYRGHLENKRLLWTLHVKKWEKKKGMWVPEYHVMWEDQKRPWCKYTIQDLLVNANPGLVNDAIGKINSSRYKTEPKKRKKNKRNDR